MINAAGGFPFTGNLSGAFNQNTTAIWNGSANSTSFLSNIVASGTVSSGNPSPYLINLNLSDNIDGSALTNVPVTGLNINEEFGGPTTKGGRTGLNVLLCQCDGADTDASGTGDKFFVGESAYAFFRYTQPGATTAVPLGRVFGFNANSQVQHGFTASNLYEIASAEFDIGLSSGSSAAIRTGIVIANLGSSSAIPGYWDDNALWLYGSGTPWLNGFMIGDRSWPIDNTNGTMIAAKIGTNSHATQKFQAKFGVDWQQVLFPSDGTQSDGGFLRSSGFEVDGAGAIYQNSCKQYWQNSGYYLDCPNAVGTVSSIASGGGGYATSGSQTVPVQEYGGVWLLSVHAGTASSVLQLVAPTFPNSSVPSNPITPTNLNPQETGSGAQLNITWNTTSTTVNIGTSASSTINIGKVGDVTNLNGTVVFTGPTIAAGPVPMSLPGGVKAGRYYSPAISGGGTAETPSATSTLYVAPIYVGSVTASLKSLSFFISNADVAAWNARMCMFSDTGSGLPGALVVDTGNITVSGNANGVISSSVTASLSGPGWFWVGWMGDTTSVQVYSFAGNQAVLLNDSMVGFNSANNAFTVGLSNGYHQAQLVSSGCPANFSGSPTDSNGSATPIVVTGY